MSTLVSHYFIEYEILPSSSNPRVFNPDHTLHPCKLSVQNRNLWTTKDQHTNVFICSKILFHWHSTVIHGIQQAAFIIVDLSSCPLLPVFTVMAQFISHFPWVKWFVCLFVSLVEWAAADSSLTTHHNWPFISPLLYFPNEIVSPDLQVKSLI